MKQQLLDGLTMRTNEIGVDRKLTCLAEHSNQENCFQSSSARSCPVMDGHLTARGLGSHGPALLHTASNRPVMPGGECHGRYFRGTSPWGLVNVTLVALCSERDNDGLGIPAACITFWTGERVLGDPDSLD